MTLVAAYRDTGIPFLVGDFLVSTDNQPSGSRKKIHLISPNLVIGCTGDLIAASPVVGDLYREFSGRHVSKDELDHYLINYPTANLRFSRVIIVGWIVDGEGHCFWWDSAYPVQVNEEPYFYTGTGAEAFEKLAGAGSAPSQINEKSISDAITGSLNIVCRMMGDELLFQRNRRMGFGFAYELLYFNGTEFKYIEDVLYIMCDFYLDNKSKIVRHNINKTFYKYRNFSNHSVVQINDLEKNKVTAIGVMPVFEKSRAEINRIMDDISRVKGLPLTSDIYCILCSLIPPNNSTTIFPLIAKPAKDEVFLEETDGAINFKFDTNIFVEIERFYQYVLADMEKNKVIRQEVVVGPGKTEADGVLVIDGYVWAISIAAVKMIGNDTHVVNSASSAQATTRERAEEIGLRQARQQWPSSEGWSHNVCVQEIPIDIKPEVRRLNDEDETSALPKTADTTITQSTTLNAQNRAQRRAEASKRKRRKDKR